MVVVLILVKNVGAVICSVLWFVLIWVVTWTFTRFPTGVPLHPTVGAISSVERMLQTCEVFCTWISSKFLCQNFWKPSLLSQFLTQTIATNHSDFGGILPLFMQYSAIPIGMTKFRQN